MKIWSYNEKIRSLFLIIALTSSAGSDAAYYEIDMQGSNVFIDFRIQHLGINWVSGSFNSFSGNFRYNEANPSAAKVVVDIDVASVDSDYSNLDKQLLGEKYLDVSSFPKAHFVSTSFEKNDDGTAVLWGEFTFHGVTKPLKLNISLIEYGDSPRADYRLRFLGTASFKLSEYDIDVFYLWPFTQVVSLTLSIQGRRESLNED